MSETLSGYVSRVVFNRDDFYILAMRVLDSSPPVAKPVETARGNLFGLLQVRNGTPLRLVGEWQVDPKHGRQFVIRSWEPWALNTSDVIHFLHTCIEGFVDIELADVLAAEYGLQTFAKLTERPVEAQELFRVNAIHEEDAQGAILGWEQTLATRDLSGMLRDGGLGVLDVQAAILKFGMEAPSIIRENPYRLMEISTLAFPKVDKLATAMGVAYDDTRRVEGAILWSVHTAARSGHLFVQLNGIVAQVSALMVEHNLVTLRGDPQPVFQTAIRNLIIRKTLILDPKAGVYVPELFDYERKSAAILASLLASSTLDVDLKPFLLDYEQSNRLKLSDAQREAVEKLTKNRVLVLTGLPGTGKTLTTRVLVRAFEASGINFALMAPTGIASKRLASVTGHIATTIHRGLKYDGSNWGHHETNRLLCDAVILDECSMVDQELLYRLLVALRPDVRVIFVGDDAQLPSVGPGNVLRELVSCEAVPNVRLTQIFRQSEKGEIVVNAHRINRGEMISTLDERVDTEFKFVRMSDEEGIVKLIVEMASKLKDRNANFQVLSAKYEGIVGVNNLNECLRDRLNPAGPKEWKGGEQHFRLGDRLMVIKNDYKLGVYNGDVGKLVDIGRKHLTVKIHGVGEGGVDMEVDFDERAAEDKLRLAYAVTVHRSQGNEFDTIILPIVVKQGRMLQRNLLYTAITRARQRVWLLGEELAVRRAIDNNQVIHRNSAFAQAIRDAITEQSLPGGVSELNGKEPERVGEPEDTSSAGNESAGRVDAKAEGHSEGVRSRTER